MGKYAIEEELSHVLLFSASWWSNGMTEIFCRKVSK